MASNVSKERLEELKAAKNALLSANAVVAAAAREQKLRAAEFQALMLRTSIECDASPEEQMTDEGTWARVMPASVGPRMGG